MKVVQEKESVMGVSGRKKNPSHAITVWHHSDKPRDARQWSLGRIFLSTPHTNDRSI